MEQSFIFLNQSNRLNYCPMNLQTLLETAVAEGIKADPRGKKGVQKFLERAAKAKAKAVGHEKEWHDDERLWNPYADTRIVWGDPETKIKRMLVGIDIETPELVLADKLKEKKRIDAVMIHHPEGRALWDLDQVMQVQVDIAAMHGVPENQADHLLKPRREQVYRRLHFRNILRTEQAAQLLGMPIVCVHNCADHMVANFMYKTVLKKNYDTVGEIIKALEDIPEYEHYRKKGNPPIIANGAASNRPGKTIIWGFNGGCPGPSEMIELLAEAGVGTFLSMHIGEEDRKMAAKHGINVIQCSHMASDSLGMNLVLDKVSGVEIVECSGFVREKRG